MDVPVHYMMLYIIVLPTKEFTLLSLDGPIKIPKWYYYCKFFRMPISFFHEWAKKMTTIKRRIPEIIIPVSLSGTKKNSIKR